MKKYSKILHRFKLVIAMCFYASVLDAANGDYSPLSFGLLEAKDGIERYDCLYRTHRAALEAGVNVSYKGIDTLDIEISETAKSIPLTENTDFCGIVLRVRNVAKGHFVFELSQKVKDLKVEKSRIDTGNFSDVSSVSSGRVVLVLEDNNPWVKNRRGYQYGAIRKDLIYLLNGKAQNRPVSAYNTETTSPKVTYYMSSSKPKRISNITFIRCPENTMRAYLFRISNQSNIIVSNIVCETPDNTLSSDQLISVLNCANMVFKDITIHGTYSQENKSGYGISMNNVYNVSFYRLVANAKWGIFGNNNVNRIRLFDSDINRFDVHCYGRDIFFKNCRFRNLYNQFSSIFGTVSFRKCEFFDFIPVLFEPSYNAYTKFDLIFNNCVIHANKGKNYLISGGELTGINTSERAELRRQEYPIISINGLKIEMPEHENTFYLYRFRTNILHSTKIEGIHKVKKVKFMSAGNIIMNVLDTSNQKSLLYE